MPLINSSIISRSFVINILFSFIPISFIAGNLLLNANILLLLISSLLFYKTDIFKEKISIIDKVIILLFIYVFSIGFYNNFIFYFFEDSKDFTIIIKTLSYLRFLLFYFVLSLRLKKLINIKF